jgi:uncharacterized protein
MVSLLMKKLSFDSIVRRLSETDIPRADLVIGISRGGIVPAALVAYRIDAPLKLMKISFRGPGNETLFAQPEVKSAPALDEDVKTVLLVDDAAVTGATLAAARKCYKQVETVTLVFRGEADCVLFPEIKGCVEWPWKDGVGPTEGPD